MMKMKPYLPTTIALTNCAPLQNDHAQWFPVAFLLEIEQQIPLQHKIASLPVLIDLPSFQKPSLSVDWGRRCKHTQILLVYLHYVVMRKYPSRTNLKANKPYIHIHNIQLFVRPRYRHRIVNKNCKTSNYSFKKNELMECILCQNTSPNTHYSNNTTVYTPNCTSVDYPNAMQLCKLLMSFSTADIISITFLINKVNLLEQFKYNIAFFL